MNRVSIIIPNYNGKHFLKPCLDALRHQSMADFSVVIVDNGSSDGSVGFIEENYPEAALLKMGENTGFCRAVNEGVKFACEEYVLLLNNDTIPDEFFVEALLKAIDDNPQAFSVSSRMLTVQNPDIMDGAGDLYNALGWASARGKGRAAAKFDKTCKIFSACAGAAIYRRAEFLELGLLDENHFAYLEDMDIGYRARIKGWENLYAPDARVIHVGSGTSGSRYNEFKIRHSARNNVYLIYKNMPLLQRIINLPFHLIGFGIKILFFKKKGYGELYIRSLKEGRALAKSQRGRERRVKYEGRYLKNYCRIQLELWANMFKRHG